MMTFIIVLHVTACLILITLVLIQRGRGGGLVESFAGVESMFGTKTSSFLTRTTTVMSIVFFITCLLLAFISVKQSKSLMTNVRSDQATAAAKQEVKTEEAVKPQPASEGGEQAAAVAQEKDKKEDKDKPAEKE